MAMSNNQMVAIKHGHVQWLYWFRYENDACVEVLRIILTLGPNTKWPWHVFGRKDYSYFGHTWHHLAIIVQDRGIIDNMYIYIDMISTIQWISNHHHPSIYAVFHYGSVHWVVDTPVNISQFTKISSWSSWFIIHSFIPSWRKISSIPLFNYHNLVYSFSYDLINTLWLLCILSIISIIKIIIINN